MLPTALSAAGALLLFFVVPGLGICAAVFPERIRPTADRYRNLLEVGAISVLTSLSVTILLGEVLQAGPGFSAGWGDPRLEVLDLTVGIGGLAIGALRGAFRRPGPVDGRAGPASASDPAWETLRGLERLASEERRVARSLRRSDLGEGERATLERRRSDLIAQRRILVEQRERDYAS